ncbi:unnamed protein product [Phaeothamnion confervicola]
MLPPFPSLDPQVDIRLPALARDAEDGARAAQEDPLLLDIVGKMAATWAMRGSGRVRVALNSVVVAAAARNSLAASPNGPGSSGSSSQGESSGAAPPGRRASASSFPANAAATAASAAATAGRGIDGRRRLGRSAAVRPDVRVVALDAGAAAQAGDDLLVLVRPNNAREHGKLEAVQIAAARAGGLHVPVVLVNPELSCYHGRHETLFRPNLLADFRTCFHLDLAAARYDRRRSVAVLRRYPRAYELYFKLLCDLACFAHLYSYRPSRTVARTTCSRSWGGSTSESTRISQARPASRSD